MLRAQSAMACGCGGELCRLHASGSAQRATRLGGVRDPSLPAVVADVAVFPGKKVSAVQGRPPDGAKPVTTSINSASSAGLSAARRAESELST